MDVDHLIDLTPLRPQRPPTEEREDLSIAALQLGPDGGRVPPVLSTETAYTPRLEELSYIWGTRIAVEEFKADFRAYLEGFELVGLKQPQLAPQVPPQGAALLLASHVSDVGATGGSSCGASERYYLKEMFRIHLQGRNTLEIDLTWLQRTSPTMYQQVVNHPIECLQMMGTVAEELYRDVLRHRHGISVAEDFILHVVAKHLPFLITIKQLSPHHLEQLLSIKGMVIRVSKVIPEIRVACFQCWSCRSIERSVSGDKGRIFEPTHCSHCGQSYSFRLQHNLSVYEDKQLIKLQESPEHVADGETPVSISVVVYANLVDSVVPGDRVIVTGIYRSAPLRLNANTRIIKSIFSTHLDAVHIELARTTRLGGDRCAAEDRRQAPSAAVEENSAGSRLRNAAAKDTARLDVFHGMARRPDIHDILLNSFARSIWGHDDVRRGILAQLFGGTPKNFVFDRCDAATTAGADTQLAGPAAVASRNSAFFRSSLNVILCGDPGVAKSQLLTQVHEIAPRGVYTSGKGSSSVGLTAFVAQDHDTGEFVLEPGALVLSDQGLCCIDEFDKMNEATRSVLHEVMEQQTLSVAKAGIIAQLNARTSILAAANPKESQWNPHLNVVENLQIEPTLLSRFDLIFLLLDRHDPAEDRRLAAHVLSLYMNNADNRHTEAGGGVGARVDPLTGQRVEVLLQHEGEVFLLNHAGRPYMPPAILSEYINIARDTVFPRLTEASHRQLATSYVELRRSRGSRTVSATLRQLESMIRLAESRAKMRYSAEVTIEDVVEAKRLISAALKEAATDPRTGLINLDMFHAPDPTKNTVEGNMRRLEEIVARHYRAGSGGRHTVPVAELRTALNEKNGGLRAIGPAQFLELLAIMCGGDCIQSFTSTTVTLAADRSATVL